MTQVSLNEAFDNGPGPKLDDHADIRRWLVAWSQRTNGRQNIFVNLESWNVSGEGLVNVTADVTFTDINEHTYKPFRRRVPLNFGSVQGSFYACADWVETFEGMPRIVTDTLNVSGSNITSWEHAPSWVGSMKLTRALLDAVEPKYASRITVRELHLHDTPEPVCLPKFMFFNGLEKLIFHAVPSGSWEDSQALIKLVEAALRRHDTARGKALWLQQELIDADFDAWAEL